MKIITANIEKIKIREINKFCGKDLLYHSRSEFVRIAVRDLLIQEFSKLYQQQEDLKNPKDPNKIIICDNGNSKIYTIIKK